MIIPKQFQVHHPLKYPVHSSIDFERWFFENFYPRKTTARTYLPILWTGYYCTHKYGNDPLAIDKLQKFICELPKIPYYTICQYDDGILNDLTGHDVFVFSMSGRPMDYPLPLIAQPLPYIAVPEKFDLVSAAAIGEELKAAKEAKANPIIINAMEQDYTAKKFAHEPGLKDLIGLTLLLDPLAGVTEDDKMTRLSNNGISQLTYVISSNIQEFVQDAIDQDKTFAEKPLKVQKEVIKKMGEEVLNPIEKQVLDAANNIGNNQVDQSVSTDNTRQPTGDPGGATQATQAA